MTVTVANTAKSKEIDNLKKEIFEIKQMMQLILNKL